MPQPLALSLTSFGSVSSFLPTCWGNHVGLRYPWRRTVTVRWLAEHSAV